MRAASACLPSHCDGFDMKNLAGKALAAIVSRAQ
jgi:hypothetical protein